MQNGSITAEEAQSLKDSLKRCPKGTYEAAIAYRETGDPDEVPKIVMGIVERYVEPEVRPKVQSGDDSQHLIDDLGIDSLTMMEIVILVEEVLQVSFDNAELRELRTVGDIKSYMAGKLAKEDGQNSRSLRIGEIAAVLPQQPPFLFLQEATLNGKEGVGKYTVSGSETVLEGHFKDNPVFPASILLEALGQLGVLHLLKTDHSDLDSPPRADAVFFASCDGVRCHHICRPGDQLDLRVKLKRLRAPMATYEGSISVNGAKAAFAEELTLVFATEDEPELDGEAILNGRIKHSTKAPEEA